MVDDWFAQKLDKAATAVDDSDRMRKVPGTQISGQIKIYKYKHKHKHKYKHKYKPLVGPRYTVQVLENRAMQDEERMAKLEEELKEVYLFGLLSSTDFSN